MTRFPSLPRTLRIAVVTAAAAALVAACGEGEDTSTRRPIGQMPGPGAQQQLPEDHPPVGGMAPGARDGAGPSVDGAGARRDLPTAVAAHLDSGNAAYRAGDYEEARRQYREAVRQDSTAAAGWFGVHMAERALGNRAAADAALERAGGLGDASGVHAAPDDTTEGDGGASPSATRPGGGSSYDGGGGAYGTGSGGDT